MTDIRDRLRIWGHPAGAHNGAWKLGHESRITPVEWTREWIAGLDA